MNHNCGRSGGDGVGWGTEIAAQCGEGTFGSMGRKNKLHTPRKQRNKINDKRTVRHEKIKTFFFHPFAKIQRERVEIKEA